MSAAADLIAELRASGVRQVDIARQLGRSTKMVRKVETGETSGESYLGALRAIQRGETVAPPPRRSVSIQSTPAGRYIRVGSRGMVGLYNGLRLDELRRDRRVSITVEYRDRNGEQRRGVLYSRGGRAVGGILDDLEALGARRGDSASIRAALRALVSDDGAGNAIGGGGSPLRDVRTIDSVTVSPA